MGADPSDHLFPGRRVLAGADEQPHNTHRPRLVGVDGRPTGIFAGEVRQREEGTMRRIVRWGARHWVMSYLVIAVTIILILNVTHVIRSGL
jgi:hypothetical protein